jgi:hypothetical protein
MKKKTLFLVLAVILVTAFATPVFAQKTTVYFFDTYGEIKDDPSIMFADRNWAGFKKTPMKDEGGSWYSFELSNTPMKGFNMVIWYNGLPDNNKNCIQWVWRQEHKAPNGVYFIADRSNSKNKAENNFQGEQRNAKSFATKEEAEAAAAAAPR